MEKEMPKADLSKLKRGEKEISEAKNEIQLVNSYPVSSRPIFPEAKNDWGTAVDKACGDCSASMKSPW